MVAKPAILEFNPPAMSNKGKPDRQVHGAGLLHWRRVQLEPLEAGAQSRCRRRSGAARLIPAGDAGDG